MKKSIISVFLLFLYLQATSQELSLQNLEPRQIRFLENRISQINGLEDPHSGSSALDRGVVEGISNMFIRLSEAFPDEGNRMLFRMAVTHYVTDPAMVYTILRDDIHAAAERRAAPNLAREIRRYNLSEDQVPLISKIVFNRAKQLTIYGYVYGNDAQRLDEKTNLIENEYQRELQTVLTRQGIRTNLSKYTLALDWREDLSLTEEQVEQVLSAGWELFERNRVENFVSIRDAQHKVAKEILNSHQYEQYLTHLVMERAVARAQADWNEASRFGLVAESRRAMVCPELLAYHIERARILERFRIFPERILERDEQLSNLRVNNRPAVVGEINTARSNAQVR